MQCILVHVVPYVRIEIITPHGPSKCKAVVLVYTADLPARAMIANMKQFSGSYACTTCTDEGKNTWSSNSLHRVWPYGTSATVRTVEDVKRNIREAVSTGKAVCYFVSCCMFCIIALDIRVHL